MQPASCDAARGKPGQMQSQGEPDAIPDGRQK